MGGWNDGGGYRHKYPATKTPLPDDNPHTVSNPPLASTLSVVAATLPPFRCKSHIISRRPSCGNIFAICSTSAGLAARGFLEEVELGSDFLKKK